MRLVFESWGSGYFRKLNQIDATLLIGRSIWELKLPVFGQKLPLWPKIAKSTKIGKICAAPSNVAIFILKVDLDSEYHKEWEKPSHP